MEWKEVRKGILLVLGKAGCNGSFGGRSESADDDEDDAKASDKSLDFFILLFMIISDSKEPFFSVLLKQYHSQ
jgi:hypothetical protein